MRSMEWRKLTRESRNWREAIGEAGIILPSSSEILSGRSAPGDFGEPFATDIVVDGILCDIYRKNSSEDTIPRVFVHQKA